MSGDAARDAAWVSVEAPFPAHRLQEFLGDPERLFRINPLLEVHNWGKRGSGGIRFEGRNLSNGKAFTTELSIQERKDGLWIGYQGLLKTSTTFHVEPRGPQASLLTITDDYSGTPEQEREARLDEVDRSLLQWGQDLHRYLQAWRRWSWLPPWRWYMTRVWQPMKPSARRITRWVIWITLGEMAVFLLVLAILVLEQ